MKQPRTTLPAAMALTLLGLTLSACSFNDEAGDDKANADAGGASADIATLPSCPPGLAGCVANERVVCNDDGSAYVLKPCPADRYCAVGKCADCAADEHCDVQGGEVCLEGACAVPKLEVVTEALPSALLGKSYAALLEAKGGVPPYSWKLGQGTLPGGLLLEASGKLGGIATAKGKASILVAVNDSEGSVADRILVVEVLEGGLLIVTPSPLKKATEGSNYSVALAAKGGTKPYFWGLLSGALPAGLALSADGNIAGIPAEDGLFSFDIKAFDNGAPTESTVKGFELNVGLAPLEIVGQQEVNLFITKLIVLPLIIVVNGIPVPYNGKLEAKGGKKPYTWAEEPLPGALKSFVPNGGIPKGLKLNADGSITGAVTDPSLAVEVKIPLSQISLKGFFFGGRVTDSQKKAATKSAIFIIPTAPVG